MSDEHADYESVGKAFDRHLLARLRPFVGPDAKAFVIGLLLMFVITALQIAGPRILGYAVDGPGKAGSVAADKAPYIRQAFELAAAFLLVVVATFAARYSQFVVLNRAGLRVLHRIRVALFAHLQRVPVSYFDKNPTGRLVTRVTNDVETLNELFTSGAVTLVGDVVTIVALVVAIFFLNPWLALIAVIGIPAFAAASAFFRIRSRQAYRETRTAIARVTSWLGETISGIRVLQSFAREDKASANFAERNRRYLETNLRTVFYFALFFPVVDLISAAIQGGVFWRGGVEILGQRLSYGEFFIFWQYLAFIFDPLRELAERYNVLQSAMASAERVFHVLDAPAEPVDADAARTADRPRGKVEFADVKFSYRPGQPVLNGVTFTIEPGETVALVGATGGGKTTITQLLARFYDPDSGVIRLDDVDLRDYQRRSLRRSIAYVPQDVFLFTGTVLENLAIGGLGVTEERARAAARAIGAAPFIERFPDGDRHVLAERGQNLAAGERQLLAFARALAVDPSVLILDEATANVDPHTEAEIQRAIGTLLAGRTSLVIAHRLSTIRRASRILVLHRGQIHEQGTHEELMKRNGLYSRLYRLQFSGAEPPGRVVGDRSVTSAS